MSKNEAPTLIDRCVRETFRKQHHSSTVHPSIRNLLIGARRFVLDETASGFLSDLSFVNYHNKKIAQGARVFDASRVLARLPHKITWMEYDAGACDRRSEAAGYLVQQDLPLDDPSEGDVCTHFGMLMQEHHQIDTAFRLTIFIGARDGVQMLPYDLAWRTDEGSIPWLPTEAIAWESPHNMVAMALGFVIETNHDMSDASFFCPTDYDRVTAMRNVFTDRPARKELRRLMVIGSFHLRRALSLLSAINDIPMGIKQVTASRGFIAQGRYRRFLDHTVVSLKLPKGRDPYKLARSVIATSCRRAHEVRGHWRRDWRHDGVRIWIKEHQRGDASKGFVTHEFEVTA